METSSVEWDVDMISYIVHVYCVLVAGWGIMEVVATRVVPLWVDARGVEFSWSSLQTGLEANITLVGI